MGRPTKNEKVREILDKLKKSPEAKPEVKQEVMPEVEETTEEKKVIEINPLVDNGIYRHQHLNLLVGMLQELNKMSLALEKIAKSLGDE